MKEFTWFWVGIFCFFCLVMTVLFSLGTDEDVAQKALKRNNYTDVVMTGYDFFGCNKGDFYHSGFTAKDPNGTPVRGTVCSGFFKGSYIRIDD